MNNKLIERQNKRIENLLEIKYVLEKQNHEQALIIDNFTQSLRDILNYVKQNLETKDLYAIRKIIGD